MMLSHMRLRRWYRVYNARYFDGSLPAHAPVMWAPVEKCWGCTLPNEKDRTAIRINPISAIDSRLCRMTLIHEMVHLKLWPNVTHGAEFQREMLRLANAGAMKGLW